MRLSASDIFDAESDGAPVLWSLRYARRVARAHGADLNDADFVIALNATTVCAATVLYWLGY